MTPGTLYGIGIGPGDPDLVTVRGCELLAGCRHAVVPKASESADSLALRIIRKHLNPAAEIHEVVFPMIIRKDALRAQWKESADYVAALLARGGDVCFPTLGDAFLYSTYAYLVRALRNILPDARIVTVPGVTAFSAAAAATEFTVGEGKQPVTIIPTADDPADLRDALSRRGTVVIMKVGKRLDSVLDMLEEYDLTGRSVFASHVGMPDEHVEKDISRLRGRGEHTGYLSIILTRTRAEGLE